MQNISCNCAKHRVLYDVKNETRMETEAEIEVVISLLRQVRAIRSSSRMSPYMVRSAAAWEIKLGEELKRLRQQSGKEVAA